VPAAVSDFAAAGMLRLIGLGLQAQGLAVPELPLPPAAHVPLARKRALAEGLLQAHGPLALLRIGEAAPALAAEPPLQALVLARDPADLLQRWQRLERFVHSRHRVQVLDAAPGRLLLRHVSLRAAEPPTLAEDCLVFGLLIALAQALGSAGLEAVVMNTDHQPGRWRCRDGRWTHAGPLHQAATWALRWQSTAHAPPPPRPTATTEAADLPGSARATLQADPGRHWTVPALAKDLQLSPRTLQRRLAEAGSRFGRLLAEARAAAAAQLLTGSPASPAEIGYACGFADQAHFTREFKRRTALTPALYRAEFSQPPGKARRTLSAR